jgi:hypothetical protein
VLRLPARAGCLRVGKDVPAAQLGQHLGSCLLQTRTWLLQQRLQHWKQRQ